jgi:hypothetical protein
MIAERKYGVSECILKEVIRYEPATSKRLMLGLRANLKPFVGELYTQGESNLDKIPPGTPVIWAMTHATSDVELQSGMLVVGEKFNTAMTDHSTHHSMEDTVPYLSQKLVGMDNFYPITYKRGKNGGKGREVFRVEDFERMLEAFEQEKAVAIAAHNPAYDSILPDNAGYGMVALASLASSRLGRNALIVPVSMDFHEEEPLAIGGNVCKVATDFIHRKKTDVTVHVGAPMQIDPVDMETYMQIRSKQDRTTAEDVETIRALNDQLRTEGAKVMHKLAAMLPEQKRGVWGNVA